MPASICQLLLVEDDAELRAAMADTLADHGYEVLEAANGNQAIVTARTGGPALILLDLMMPVMDGWTFLRHRAADLVLSAIPVIVLSAQRDVELAADASVLQVMTKPAEIADLLAAISRVCDARRR